MHYCSISAIHRMGLLQGSFQDRIRKPRPWLLGTRASMAYEGVHIRKANPMDAFFDASVNGKKNSWFCSEVWCRQVQTAGARIHGYLRWWREFPEAVWKNRCFMQRDWHPLWQCDAQFFDRNWILLHLIPDAECGIWDWFGIFSFGGGGSVGPCNPACNLLLIANVSI